MEFVIDALLRNPLVQGIAAAVMGMAAWWLKGVFSKRAGAKQARKEARQDDVAAAAEIHRRAADADRLRDEPSLGRRD